MSELTAAVSDRKIPPGETEWEEFSSYLISQHRYVLDEHWTSLVGRIVESAKRRRRSVNAGTAFFRARLHGRSQRQGYAPDQMGSPPPEAASAGRLNSEGIPCLYLAEDLQTAIAEVRPWVSADVTVGRFLLSTRIDVVDLTIADSMPIDEEDAGLWKMINTACSIPFHPDDTLAYVPTQFIADVFRKAGFVGVRYSSAMRPDGINVALFDSSLASTESVECHRITRIAYGYE